MDREETLARRIAAQQLDRAPEIGRASCRERVSRLV